MVLFGHNAPISQDISRSDNFQYGLSAIATVLKDFDLSTLDTKHPLGSIPLIKELLASQVSINGPVLVELGQVLPGKLTKDAIHTGGTAWAI